MMTAALVRGTVTRGPGMAYSQQTFKLSKAFVESYRTRKAPFGFNGLGEFVYRRTYARPIADADGGERSEDWHETVARVVDGTMNMQVRLGGAAVNGALRDFAEEMFDAIFHMRFLPPGRGLWAMGSTLTEERGIYAALNNCAFVSTERLASAPTEPFAFLKDASMLGIGVGFDTKGAGALRVVDTPTHATRPHLVADSREGWVDAYRALLAHYFCNAPRPVFDFSQVRPAGAPIRGFGGVSGGPGPLMDLLDATAEVLERQHGQLVGERTIVDLMNLIGKAVVSGNVRRTAEIAFGQNSAEFLNLKNYRLNPERSAYGWTSNNSIFADVGMDYSDVAERIRDNGEPGLIWLENMRAYSRMIDPPDHKDARVQGSNPCVEQSLESFELCCLVETFPLNCRSEAEWLRTLELAFTYAKTVTLGDVPWPASSDVMRRNRRIGTSISGIAQFVARHGLDTLRHWCHLGYAHLEQVDRQLSARFGVPVSVKRTSVKPSGTVSLLAGATPGVHFPIAPYYLRRVRLPFANPLLPKLRAAGYHIEPDVNDANTAVVEFPVYAGDANIPSLHSVSIWEQFQTAAFMQRHWADNSVSCTVTFDPQREGHSIARCLDHYQYALKGISLLPNSDKVFPQMPYEEISESRYHSLSHRIQELRWDGARTNEAHTSEYCDNDSCSVKK